jgi:hypothetical protein
MLSLPVGEAPQEPLIRHFRRASKRIAGYARLDLERGPAILVSPGIGFSWKTGLLFSFEIDVLLVGVIDFSNPYLSRISLSMGGSGYKHGNQENHGSDFHDPILGFLGMPSFTIGENIKTGHFLLDEKVIRTRFWVR